MIPTPNEDPLGFGLDYGEMEEGEIDDVVEADTQLQVASESKGNSFYMMLFMPKTLLM